MGKTEYKPAIRFKGFTDAWEQRKVGEVSKRVIVGLATSVTPYYRAEGIPILRNLNIKENYLDDVDILFLERSYAESQVSKQIHTGDVLTVHTGYIGTSCVVPEKYDNCLTFTTLITTTDGSVLQGEFLAQYLNSEIGMSAVQAVTTQGGRQNLNTNDFVKVEIRYPSLAEQDRICKLLRDIDSLITLHQRKYDKLVNIKKSMLEKMFPRDGATVPEIRFAGFTDAWEQRKLGDTFGFLQNNTLSRADLNPETGVAKNVHYGDVLIKFGEYLDASSSTLPYIPTQQIVDKFKGSLLQDGDVIMADTAEDEAVGKCTEIAGLQGFPTISGLHTIPLRPKEKFAPGYLGYYMNSGSYHDQLLPLMQGIKVTSVSKSAILNTDISFPAENDEQAEIGSFFIRLDNLITLHQRELKSEKQGGTLNVKHSKINRLVLRVLCSMDKRL